MQNGVVLSAFNANSGGSQGAEAFCGTPKTFFYAGSRALLVTHSENQSEAAVTDDESIWCNGG